MSNGLPNLPSTTDCQWLDESAAASKAGSDSNSIACSLLAALARKCTTKSRCGESILRGADVGISSAISRSVQGMLTAALAATSVSIASVLAVTGNMSRVLFIAIPGR